MVMPISGENDPEFSWPVLNDTTRVTSVWKAKTIRSYIKRMLAESARCGGIAVEASCHVGRDLRSWFVEPAVGSFDTNFNLPDGSQVILQTATILVTELIAKRTSVVQNGIEHTAAAFEVAALPGDSPSRFGKEPFENPTRALFVRELDAVGIVGMAVAADLQR